MDSSTDSTEHKNVSRRMDPPSLMVGEQKEVQYQHRTLGFSTEDNIIINFDGT